jgi:predicted amidohydrolase YtcJ
MSFHILYVNSKALKLVGYDRSTDIEGVVKDLNNQPTGEIRELHALQPFFEKFVAAGSDFILKGLLSIGNVAKRAGLTTISELGLGIIPNAWKSICTATSMNNYPVRISVYI